MEQESIEAKDGVILKYGDITIKADSLEKNGRRKIYLLLWECGFYAGESSD